MIPPLPYACEVHQRTAHRNPRNSTKNGLSCAVRWVLPLLLGIAALTQAKADEPERTDQFEKGNRAYMEGAYKTAVTHYEQALKNGHSAAVHANMARTYEKLDQPGRAMRHYRMAYYLKPRSPKIAKPMHALAREQGITLEWLSPKLSRLHQASRTEWQWLAVAAFWIALISLGLCKLHNKRKSLYTIITILGITLLMVSILGLYSWKLMDREYVVIAPESALRVAPSSKSDSKKKLQAGSLVYPIDSHQQYWKVKHQSKSTGWVANDQLSRSIPNSDRSSGNNNVEKTRISD